jgi:hypothetical protein
MKVYVFGHDKGACIDLANQLNEKGASAIIAKDEEGLREVAGRIGKAFERAVMVSTDPIRDSVSANRDTRVRAAVCYNQKTLKAAASVDINLFILESDANERLDLSDILGTSVQKQQQPLQKNREPAPQPKKEKEQRKQQATVQTEPRDRSGDNSKGGGGGVGSRLKDIFGIEE